MGVIETATGVEADQQGLRRRQHPVAIDDPAQAAAGDEFGDEVRAHAVADVFLAPVVDREDVGVAEGRDRLGVLTEAPMEPGFVGARRGEQLHRHLAFELEVDRFVGDRMHTAAQRGTELIAATEDSAVEGVNCCRHGFSQAIASGSKMRGMLLRPRRPIDRALLVASAAVAIGIGLIVFAFTTATTGRDATGLPDALETISPEDGDEVLRQTAVVVDLLGGYTGELIIDRQTIPVRSVALTDDSIVPGQEVGADILVTSFDPGSATLTFQPRQGAPIESFATGTHQVTVVYWPQTQGRDAARSFTWQFKVTA